MGTAAFVVMELLESRTPSFVVDPATARANSRRMVEKARRLGVRLRPHVKTHKTLEGARLQTEGAFGGITVSTLAEARFFGEGGFEDITYAVPLAPAKLAEAAELSRRLGAFHLLLDSRELLTEAASCAAQTGEELSFFLKVDCGYHRAGLDPEAPWSLELAREVQETTGVRLAGVLAHGGHAYGCRSREAVGRVAEEERRVTVGFAEKLRRQGIAIPVVSLGSTPTLSVAEDLSGVDEVRPGNYFFFDSFQAALGSCRLEDVACFVLATVIGCYPERGCLLVDAGALALSKDGGGDPMGSDPGFGTLLSADGGEILAEMRLISLCQEHGKILAPEDLCRRFPVGSRLRILPNHSCLAAALFDEYLVLQGHEIRARWRPVRGW